MAMAMANKYCCMMLVLVVVLLASQQAEAQLSTLLGVLNINGTLFCSVNGAPVANATTPTLPFPNAQVQISCGGNVVASATTNGAGVFSIVTNPLFLLSNLLSSCNVVVATPLSSCNASLPSTGILQAPLQIIGSVLGGLLNVLNLVPGAFQLIRI